MVFLEEISTIYVVGRDKAIIENLKNSISRFIEFWNFDLRIEIKQDYFDLLLQNEKETSLFITTESAFENVENKKVFSTLKRHAKRSRILHLHDKYPPTYFEKNEQKKVHGFIDMKGDFNLQLHRLFHNFNS